MKPIAVIDAPHPAYGAQWSAAGDRLAFSGGFLYGGGYLGLADAEGRRLALADEAGIAAAIAAHAPDEDEGEGLGMSARVILPALCVDDRGEWILAAACSYKWHARGPLLFRIREGAIELALAPSLPEDEDGCYLVDRAGGAWIHRGEILVRYLAGRVDDALQRFPAPPGLGADPARSALCSARIAVIDDVAWAAKNQRGIYSRRGAGAPMTPGSDLHLNLEPHGLVAFDLRDGGEPRLHATERDERSQALVRDLAGERLYAGLGDGRIVEWRIVGRDRLERVRSWAHPGGDGRGGPIARGIQALACLADGETLASAAAPGTIALWRGGARIADFALPVPWSPRGLAAHPSAPLLAVACKGRTGYEAGAVLLYDLRRAIR